MEGQKIRCFMHVPFEGPGIIQNWVEEKKHHLEFTRFYKGDPLPDLSDPDMLIIMGGPMNVFDFHIHPWMEEEIDWVERYMEAGKPVLGICLGAQIIAAALGTDVYPGEHKEIGWFNLQFLPSLGDFKICKDLPATRKVFHWHGDTFPIPEGAIRIASTSVFPNQAFIYNRKVIALQFHLEMTPETVDGMVENCGDELVEGPYIQTAEEIRGETCSYAPNQQVMFQFLDYLSAFNP
jgi:GMP synthase (glutamine-hydrolysing)